ncbi:MAG: bifunctional nuclease family protein [Saprospiraceae bacterium]|nr:bifunctional nuclease family protein [Saprospiraceae bacterium]
MAATKKILLEIIALSHSVTQSNNYAVVLGEVNGNRRLPIVIGGYEAQAIAVSMERMIPNRPLTHDLFKNTLDSFDIHIREIIINDLIEGIFYAHLICDRNGEVIEIDSRTSDALAMAVRFDCPIYTYDHILDSAGVVLELDIEESADEPSGNQSGYYASKTSEELNQMLDDALLDENYEKAAEIRDEIKRRKGTS